MIQACGAVPGALQGPGQQMLADAFAGGEFEAVDGRVVARQLEAGQPRACPGGQVAPDWNKQQFNGIAQNSVVVLAVRKGNPEGLKSFDDLLTKDEMLEFAENRESGGDDQN